LFSETAVMCLEPVAADRVGLQKESLAVSGDIYWSQKWYYGAEPKCSGKGLQSLVWWFNSIPRLHPLRSCPHPLGASCDNRI
jgi:hypothetical protein